MLWLIKDVNNHINNYKISWWLMVSNIHQPILPSSLAFPDLRVPVVGRVFPRLAGDGQSLWNTVRMLKIEMWKGLA